MLVCVWGCGGVCVCVCVSVCLSVRPKMKLSMGIIMGLTPLSLPPCPASLLGSFMPLWNYYLYPAGANTCYQSQHFYTRHKPLGESFPWHILEVLFLLRKGGIIMLDAKFFITLIVYCNKILFWIVRQLCGVLEHLPVIACALSQPGITSSHPILYHPIPSYTILYHPIPVWSSGRVL